MAQAQADGERFDAEVSFAQKQLARIKELSELKGIEDRLVDEKQYQLQASQANKRAAASSVLSFEQQSWRPNRGSSWPRPTCSWRRPRRRWLNRAVDRAKLMVSYTKVLSPYDGVVTSTKLPRGVLRPLARARGPNSDRFGRTDRSDADQGSRFPSGRFLLSSPAIG